MAFRMVETPPYYDLYDEDGYRIASYDKLGHALHHATTEHPIEPGCCEWSDSNGNSLLYGSRGVDYRTA